MKGYVYAFENADGIGYVGSTINLEKRMRDHRIKTRGLKIEVLEEFDDISELALREVEASWIHKKIKEGVTLANGGNSDEVKKVWEANCYICGKPIRSSGWTFEGEGGKRKHKKCRVVEKKKLTVYVYEDVAEEVSILAKSKGISLNNIYSDVISMGIEAYKKGLEKSI